MTHQSESSNGYSNGSNGANMDTPQDDGGGQTGAPHYPLSDSPEQWQATSGRKLDEISLEAAAQGTLSPEDLQIGAETLMAQAEIARGSGFRELADNLTRAAELTAVPNEELLRMYEMLRPHRSTYVELNELAHTLESQYDAQVNAAFVREAAQVYQTRNLLRRE